MFARNLTYTEDPHSILNTKLDLVSAHKNTQLEQNMAQSQQNTQIDHSAELNSEMTIDPDLEIMYQRLHELETEIRITQSQVIEQINALHTDPVKKKVLLDYAQTFTI